MIMNRIWITFLSVSVGFSLLLGRGAELSAAVLQGAQAGVTTTVSIAGAICLWAGVGRLMEKTGISQALGRALMPVLGRLFPSCRTDPALSGYLSANVCANILGLGNAATPMGITAAKRLRRGDTATDELCRLVVLNTASIQLIPANVAAIRLSLGCGSPFDILPAVWLSSLASAGLGLCAAFLFGKVWHD